MEETIQLVKSDLINVEESHSFLKSHLKITDEDNRSQITIRDENNVGGLCTFQQLKKALI